MMWQRKDYQVIRKVRWQCLDNEDEVKNIVIEIRPPLLKLKNKIGQQKVIALGVNG